MRTDTNRSASFNRNQLRNVNFGHIEEELIDNYPILVRGVISEIGGFGEVSDEIADILISKYPTFVRGVIESFQAGDIEEFEESSRPNSSETTASPSNRMSNATDQNRTDNQPHGKRWRKNQRRLQRQNRRDA